MKEKIVKRYNEKKGTLSLIFVSLAFFAIMGFIFVSFYSNLKSNAINLGRKTMSESVKTVNAFLKENVDIVDVAAESIEYFKKDKVSEKEIKQYLTYTTNGYKESMDSNFTGFYGVFDGVYIDGTDWVPPIGYNPYDRPWYVAAKNGNNKTVAACPYLDAQTNTIMISIARMLSNNDDVIAVDISLSDLQAFTENIYNEGLGYCYVLDSNGVIVACNDKKNIGKNVLTGKEFKDMSGVVNKIYSFEEIYFE